MGNYLGKPVTVKESEDMENGTLVCGVSSMQGWRETQEDAHNCLINFDDDISLFAVYDGHGGAEVAQYAAENLPRIVKNQLADNESYKDALIKAYLAFDDSLIEPSVVDKLTTLRGEITKDRSDDNEVEEKLDELYEEAKLPIEDIILKYKKKLRNISKENIKDQPCSSKEASSSDTQEAPISKATDEDKSTEACSSKDIPTVTNNDETKNGVDESKPEDNNEEAGGSSSTTKVNGSIDEQTNGTKDVVPGTSNPESGSSSQDQNGSELPSGTAYLIGDDASENDTDSDSDDEMFVPAGKSGNTSSDEDNSEQDSGEDSDIDSEDESDDDSDEIDTTELYPRSLLAGICGANDDDEDDDKAGKDSGCTAVMALLLKDKLYVANAGDSRCVVSIDGKAHDMSKDHKPEDELELNRITAAGGRVSNDGRVNGGLNLSRALGDHKYKKNEKLSNTEQMITALPDVTELDIVPETTNFLVLACDGIWNSLSSQEVVDFISERINKPDIKLSSICEELFDKCLAPDTLSDGTGCDNMTCIIVKFKFNNLKRSHTETEDDNSIDVGNKKPKIDTAENSDDVAELNKPKPDSSETEPMK